jgi:uncharacterized Zn-finger protein
MNEDFEAIQRLLEEEDWGLWRKCPFCPNSFPNFSALMSHLRRDHPDKMTKKKDEE